ncbi:hypothetical protein A5634_10815 [Mycobacterium asiaticum]|uniref:Uncharacterized protein n=1 Tax=Mycobacterium asiaticum TaxID=1790 RepID=A0A1A3NL61_MYCAS|nr:hypothetical protein [Mycobacterium asiaticum]OBK21097.1 hypothetical protein A5634_10815 [Mycobacterium asiaticum]
MNRTKRSVVLDMRESEDLATGRLNEVSAPAVLPPPPRSPGLARGHRQPHLSAAIAGKAPVLLPPWLFRPPHVTPVRLSGASDTRVQRNSLMY